MGLASSTRKGQINTLSKLIHEIGVPLKFLQTLPNKSVIVAYDNDQSGNLMAQRLMEQLPNAVRRLPKTTDWNEELKNMFNLEPQQQPKQPQEPERKQSWGLSL